MIQEQISQHFFQQIQKNHLSHAYIFSGDNSSAKQEVVLSLIQALICPNFKEVGQPCYKCTNCQRVVKNQISDVMYIEPDGKSIKVDQIRDLKAWLNRSPVELNFKMAVINQADLMNPSASNALLTILEEPSSEIYLILNVIESDSMLSTIRSRAQNIVFTNDFQDKFEDVEIAKAYQEILTLLPGTTSNALRQFETEDLEEWFKSLNEYYKLLLTKSPQAFALIPLRMKTFVKLPKDSQKDSQKLQQRTDLGIDYLLLLNHQTLLNSYTGRDYSRFPLKWLADTVKDLDLLSSDLLSINEQLIEAKKYLMSNVSAQLVLERVVLNIIK